MSRASILIVDDHAGFREAARNVLVTAGFRVAGEAMDGAAAIEAVRELAPDVVLLDIRLPDIDGFEVIRALDELGTDVVVVLTSSRDASDYGTRIASSGAIGFIAKGELSGATLAAVLGSRV